jgi:hypothetical protein
VNAPQNSAKIYSTTARKHGLNLMDFIKSAFAGKPVDFAPE